MTRLRFVSLLLILVAILIALKIEPQLEVHVIAGQSNAMGYAGKAAFYPPDPDRLDARIPFFHECPGIGSSEGKWVTLGPQAGMTRKGYFGPEVTFARALKDSGGHPAIFKFTGPSKSIAKDWKGPGDGGMYDGMWQALNEALGDLEEEGKRYKVVSLTWIQGESDAETNEMTADYEVRLTRLLNDFRDRIEVPDLVILLGIDEQHPWVKERPKVVSIQQELAQKEQGAEG
jgi:hypothetical protein